jgi:hypothetical protein
LQNTATFRIIPTLKVENALEVFPHPSHPQAESGAMISDVGRGYLAGRMTGTEGFSFPIFDSVAAELRTRGIDVVTPSELDEAGSRKAALRSKDGDPDAFYRATGLTRGRLLARDLRIVIDEVDSVIVIWGWRQSKGARLETFTAWLHGKPILYYPTLRRVPDAALRSAWMGRHL